MDFKKKQRVRVMKTPQSEAVFRFFVQVDEFGKFQVTNANDETEVYYHCQPSDDCEKCLYGPFSDCHCLGEECLYAPFSDGHCPGEEVDPNGIDAHAPGAQLDAGKPRAALLKQFGLALSEVSKVSTYGAKKYSVGGWQFVPQGFERYDDAMIRHWLDENLNLNDPDSNLLHAAHVAWNALARLELLLRVSSNT